MLQGTDFEWESVRDIPDIEFMCGHCGGNITSKMGFKGWHLMNGNMRMPEYIYVCHKCGRPNYFDVNKVQYPIFKETAIKFANSVKIISSRFVEIHKQSQIAELDGLDEIAGPGYGKALEFLVKDYLIKSLPEQEKAIKSMRLYDCIHDLLDNPKIKALADKARVLRNDETHYERKYENSDIKDLKNLIGATAAWIELEAFTSEATGQ